VDLLASIPSPSKGTVELGPITLHMYGLMLAIGVVVAARIADRRARRFGLPEGSISEIATVTVIAGVVGARVYHLFTGFDWDKGIAGALKIWEGGLSIWGAVAGGAVGAIVMSRRKRLDTVLVLDAMAPGVAVAQAIGRWGNWWNQELFGRPTDLPWGLEIDPGQRPVDYIARETFHPTFLYESLWCLGLFFFLSWAERRFSFRRGQTFSLYVALYCIERFFMELLRVDPASELFGVRFNALLAIVLAVIGSAAFVVLGRRGRPALVGSNGEEVAEGATAFAQDVGSNEVEEDV
jgi:prolipoprotein diacylglyceryl transferase